MSKTDDRERMAFVMPIRPRNLVWIVILACLWGGAEFYGTPHLRIQYTWSGKDERPYYHLCDYWGLSSFRIVPADGVCPLFVLARTKREG